MENAQKMLSVNGLGRTVCAIMFVCVKMVIDGFKENVENILSHVLKENVLVVMITIREVILIAEKKLLMIFVLWILTAILTMQHAIAVNVGRQLKNC
ncbi:hypothetical protein BDFB_003282 [Asbolus verrucosus]|uniref:Uncharacterized protein n=1 Tax=Asbolus verrucosus TaxID=1661398 RepID=A0A482WC14_ASBVE|nr:hypothetical protein BDFB_003282 [Asbolus verrucosus]